MPRATAKAATKTRKKTKRPVATKVEKKAATTTATTKAAKKPTAKKATAKKATAKKATAKKATAKKATAKKATAKKATAQPAKKNTAKRPTKTAIKTPERGTAGRRSLVNSPQVPSEDELRTKIVFPFLRQHFETTDIDVEFAFSIQRGRRTEKRPRTDALVRKNGQPIFVIECKREDYDLTKKDELQAISYARLVQPTMPPYAILTNGRSTIILDAYLGRRVPSTERISRNGIEASPLAFEEAMRLRYLANKYLLQLSSDSLISFIAKEIDDQIRNHSNSTLRPPYSPTTHIPRTEIWEKLERFCSTSDKRLLPILGPATIGKTSEIFSCIRERLLPQSKIIPLYIPLNLSGAEFLPYLAETFGWGFAKSQDPVPLIHDIDSIATLQGRASIAYILDGADLDIDALSTLRKQISNFLRYTAGMSCTHKIVVVSQSATWSELAFGQSVDLSGDSDAPVFVERLTHSQTLRQIRALETFYGISMSYRAGLPALPGVIHMWAQRIKADTANNAKVSEVLGQYFKQQISRVQPRDRRALMQALTGLAGSLLDNPYQINQAELQAGLVPAITAGLIISSKDTHGREQYRFADDWICYYLVGFHVWELDRQEPDFLQALLGKASSRVEYARTLDWLSYVMGDHEIWREVAQRRPLIYLRYYQMATRHLKMLSIEEDACLWLAPYQGSLMSPWCSIISGSPERVHWGNDPDIVPNEAPRLVWRSEFTISSHMSLVEKMADHAVGALEEIRRWLLDQGTDEPSAFTFWQAQCTVFERMRRELSFRPYDLNEVVRSIQSPEYRAGVEMLHEIFEEALRLTHEVAESELFAIRDLMPKNVRVEIRTYGGDREHTTEYFLDSAKASIEVVLGRRGDSRFFKEDLDVLYETHGVTGWAGTQLCRLLYARDFPMGWPFPWCELMQGGRLASVDAVGNVARYWLAHGMSSAITRSRAGTSAVRERILSQLGREGVSETPAFLAKALQAIESVLYDFRREGRIDTWINAEGGFFVDGFWSIRPLRPGEHIFRIDAALGNEAIVLTVGRALDQHSRTIPMEGVSEAVRGLLDLFVGYPSSE